MTPLGEQEFVGIQLDPNQPIRDDLPEGTDQSDGEHAMRNQSHTGTADTSEAAPISGNVPQTRDDVPFG